MAPASRMEADRFDLSGPKHMSTMIDWDNEEHRRCIAACIVKGTYVLEKDRTGGRMKQREPALAPAWWESFHFRMVEVLSDDCGNVNGDHGYIFGAIYEHVPPAGTRRHPSAPRYVVALRGTMLKYPEVLQDLRLDLMVMANTLHQCNRSVRAYKAVVTLSVDTIITNDAVWLVGHSLGASLALEVGRRMMTEKGLDLPTFLFNPPQVSPAPAIKALNATEVAKRDLYTTSYILKAGLGLVLSSHRKRMKKLFEKLAPWAPQLYVHDDDNICLGFIDYFEQRQQIQERRCFSGVARSATTLSYRDMLFSMVGVDTEQPHLLPSATLVKNSGTDRHGAHELQQWWKPDSELNLNARRYSYP